MALLIFRTLLLLIILISSNNSGHCLSRNSNWNSNSTLVVRCRDEDREALLKIKQSTFDDRFNLLQSWESKGDCCKWKGVGCDAASGHVIKVELLPHTTDHEDDFYDDYTTDAYQEPSIKAYALSPHLLELKHLNHLDLTGIDLGGSSIPEFIGWMKQLRYLNLSNVNFHGWIPLVWGNLTKLEVLDLSKGPNLYVDDITWVSSLVALRYLDLRGVALVKTPNVLQVLATLPRLSHLALADCGLETSSLSSSSHGGQLFNSTSLFAKLQYFDVSKNMQVTLMYLDLSGNSFNSSVPIWFDSFESLVHLDLSGNDFTAIEGGLSHFIRGKCNLRYLYLGSINIGGENYSSSTTSASGIFCGGASSKLEILHAMGTQFNGRSITLSSPFPNQILETLTGLRHLVLQKNQLEGTLDVVMG